MKRALAALFCIGPFLWLVLTALRPESEITRLGLPSRLSLRSFGRVLLEQPIPRALWNSFLVSVCTTVLSIAIGALAAFSLARLRPPGRNAILGAALGVSMFPPIATVGPLYGLLHRLGLLDHWTGLLIPYTTFSLPLAIFLLTRAFEDVPEDLWRAARVDGCSPFTALVRVHLPLAAPSIATTALLVFIAAWNELLYALTFLSTPEQRTVPVAIALFSSEHAEPWGEIAAASTIATLPLVIAALLFQKRIVSGLTAGAVKG
ncbi:MAG: carbohydrate ABC transporter permease [Polyangiales bacterium]